MSQTPETDPTETGTDGDSPDGLAGGMGVSSERRGAIRGKEPVAGGRTHDSAPTHTEDDGVPAIAEGEDDGVRPDPVESTRRFDPDRNPRHG